MTKVKEAFESTIQYVILLLMGLQILLGVCWCIANLGAFPIYAESLEYISYSSHFSTDAYIGILYILVVALGKGLEGITTIPFCSFIYLIQLTAAFFATKEFVKSITSGCREGQKICPLIRNNQAFRLFLVLYIMTIAPVLQMHLSVLPYSLSLSAYLLLFSALLDRSVKKTAFAYTMGALLTPDFIWIGLILMVGTVLFAKKEALAKNRKGRLIIGAAALAALLLVLQVEYLHMNEYSRGNQTAKIQNSFSAAMMDRFVWPNFATNYYFWSDEIKAVISMEDAIHTCQREDAVENYFGPKVDAAYGETHAAKLYREMARQCFMDRTRETTLEILGDLKDYCLIPFTISENLQGNGTSLTAWNYGRMSSTHPILSRYYLEYSLFMLTVLLLGTILIITRKIKTRFNIFENLLRPALGTAMLFALWYTMRSNVPVDYKTVLPLVVIWYCFAVAGLFAEEEQEETEV